MIKGVKMEKRKYDYKSGDIILRPTNEDDFWNSKWDIYNIDKNGNASMIGWLSYEGKKETGTVPVSIEILPLYRKRGHGSDALKMAREWAFLHPNVYEVEAYSDPENSDYIGALNKAGFIYREDPSIEKRGSERYSVIRPKSTWLGLYIMIGVVVGITLGIVISIPWIGLVIGLVLSFAVGTYLDNLEKKRRYKVTGGKLDRYIKKK